MFGWHASGFLWVVTVAQTFPDFHDIDSFEKYWSVILSNVPQLRFLWFFFFLMIRLEWWILGRDSTEVKCHSHHIMSHQGYMLLIWLTVVALTLIMAEVVLTRFQRCKLLLFSPLTYCTSHVQPTVREWGSRLHPLRVKYPHNGFRILHWDFLLLPHVLLVLLLLF